MSIWTRISEALAALARGEGLAALFGPRAPERSVAFTVAVIALGAKMAKADGRVTRDEVEAFREVFSIPPGEEANAARVFNLAREDVAGYDLYARRIAAMFGHGHPALTDLLEGLYFIAMADGELHEAEEAFLAHVADLFGVNETDHQALRAAFLPGCGDDPYCILGVRRDMTTEAIRAVWRGLVRESHPDRLAARGLPDEAVRLAERRLAAVNAAWDRISAERALHAEA